MGHASRTIPIIRQLLKWKAEVIIGGDGRSFQLLEKEFPELQALELPAYDVKYTQGSGMVATTLLRAPKYLNAVRLEHKAIEEIVKQYKIDLVISDNRYGLWTKKVPCVFICHQLALIPPKIMDWATPIVYRLHRLFMDRFDEIWIPDFDGTANLSGRLAHHFPLTNKMKFIGALSRFSEGGINNRILNSKILISFVCFLVQSHKEHC